MAVSYNLIIKKLPVWITLCETNCALLMHSLQELCTFAAVDLRVQDVFKLHSRPAGSTRHFLWPDTISPFVKNVKTELSYNPLSG